MQCPVILVVNAKGISGSIVALVSGYCGYAEKMGVTITGIIANHVGSPHHADLLKTFLQDYEMPPLLAWMEKQGPVLPERHLGLVMPGDLNVPDFQPFFHVNGDELLQVFSEWQQSELALDKQAKLLADKKIAIANDAACCFIYQANIDCLKQLGATIQYFSVIKGDEVPLDADAVWLPGGYPELYVEQLSVSNSWKSFNQFIVHDKPVLAECGGAMLLGQQLVKLDGSAWPMAGTLAYCSKMQQKLASLGYRKEASGMKGHEFHYSVRETEEDVLPCFDCSRGDKGMRYKKLRASYIHWYFASSPEVIAAWLT